ncbi:hypothetical protein Tco_0264594 [Tanacetum coccineum]
MRVPHQKGHLNHNLHPLLLTQVKPCEPQTDPSHRPSPFTHIPDSIPESSGGNHGGQSSSDKSLSGNEGDMTLQSVFDLCISLCTQILGVAWYKGNPLKGKFGFIQGDDYILTSGEALAL